MKWGSSIRIGSPRGTQSGAREVVERLSEAVRVGRCQRRLLSWTFPCLSVIFSPVIHFLRTLGTFVCWSFGCIGGMSSFCNSVQSSEPYVEIQLQLPASTHSSTATNAMGPKDQAMLSFKFTYGP